MKQKPVTVICPIFISNESDFARLRHTLTSLLSQTFCEFNVILVNDRSIFSQGPPTHPSQNAKEVLLGLKRDLHLDHPNFPEFEMIHLDSNSGNPAFPRNIAIQKTQSEWIAFIDQDDLWHPQKLAKQFELTYKNQDVTMVHGDVFLKYEDASTHPSTVLLSHQANLANGHPISIADFLTSYTVMSNVLIRRSFFEETGLLKEEFAPCDDLELFLRLGLYQKKVLFEASAQVTHRIHSSSLSQNRLLILEKKRKLFHHYLHSKADAQTIPESDLQLLHQHHQHTLRLLGYHYFNTQQYPSSLEAFEEFFKRGGKDRKASIYCQCLRRKRPHWIHKIRQIKSLGKKQSLA